MRYVRSSPRGHRLHLEDLEAARREHFVELAAQHGRGLAMQDLEDRAADRLFARHTLHARLALAIPDGDAIVAIDDVESDGQRVDDALRDSALAIDLLRPLDDLGLQPLRVRRLPKHRREDVGDRCKECLLLRERRRSGRAGADRVPRGIENSREQVGAVGCRRRRRGCGARHFVAGSGRNQSEARGGRRGESRTARGVGQDDRGHN